MHNFLIEMLHTQAHKLKLVLKFSFKTNTFIFNTLKKIRLLSFSSLIILDKYTLNIKQFVIIIMFCYYVIPQKN